MKEFTKKDLEELMDSQKGPCVSIYIPGLQSGDDHKKTKIEFKNSVTSVEDKLNAWGYERGEKEEFLKPLHELLNKDDFWFQQRDGVAVFLSPDFFAYYRLPISFKQIDKVAEHFYIVPIANYVQDDEKFYILALSQNKTKFYGATKQDIEEIELEDTPTSLEEELKYDDFEASLQYSAKGPTPQGGKGEVVYHGHGEPKASEENQILRFFQSVNDGVMDKISETSHPLVLGGVEYLHAIYKEANKYPHLIEGGIEGNLDQYKKKEIHQEAWENAKEYFKREQKEDKEKYFNLKNTDQISSNITDIIPGAFYARIETLFVGEGSQVIGVFNKDTGEVSFPEDASQQGEDLLNFAILHTIKNGGKVHILEKEEMPDGPPISAIMRF